MKRIILIFTVILTTCLSASAYDFKVNGLAYNLNSDGKSVRVTYTERSVDNYPRLRGSLLVIPEKVTYKGEEYTVTAIGNYAFYSSGFTGSLTIPNTVTRIGDVAFSGCEDLETVTSYIRNLTDEVSPDFLFSHYTYVNAVLRVPESCVDIYKEAYTWRHFENIETIEGSAVNDIHVDEEDSAAWYDLSGRIYQQKPTDQGIYIHNGKKVLVK